MNNLRALRDAFVGKPDNSKRPFLQKFHDQLAEQNEEIHRVAADLIALYYLIPTNVSAEKKIQSLREVISWKVGGSPDLDFL